MTSSPAPAPSPSATRGQTLLGFAVIAAVVLYFVFRKGEPSADAPPTATPAPVSKIVASIQDFQAGIPMLEQQGLARQEEPNGIEYRWSGADGVSWVRFFDAGSDGKLDRISSLFATTQGDSEAQMMAAVFSLRLIQLASGEDVTADAFTGWLKSVADGDAVNGSSRTFGKTPAHLQAALTAKGQPGIRMIIGENTP